MADVLANDLERLSPADKAKIQGNLAGLKRQMLELTASSQAQLAEVDNLSVVSLSERLGYLASGLNLDVVEQPLHADEQWDEAALKALSDNLRQQDVALVHHRQPDAKVAAAIEAGGAKLLVVDSDPQTPWLAQGQCRAGGEGIGQRLTVGAGCPRWTDPLLPGLAHRGASRIGAPPLPQTYCCSLRQSTTPTRNPVKPSKW
jgi:hypothetical protein